MMRTERSEFLGLRFDPISKDDVLDRLSRVSVETSYSYLVTPNVDHLVRLHESGESARALKPIYDAADLCVCDSRIVQMLAKLRGVDLPVVPGSELTAEMFDRVIRSGDRIAIVGGDEQLVTSLRSQFPGVEFIHHSPPMGLRTNREARRKAAQFIAECRARFSFIAVGSPQQEMIAIEAKELAGSGMALCVGASLEFLTGKLKRAPALAQKLRLEWAHRLLSDPKRMWRRYLVEGPRIFLLTYRWPGPAQNGAAK